MTRRRDKGWKEASCYAMSKYGPTRGELKFRVAVSLFILVLMGAAMLIKGVPTGLVGIEMFLFCGGFALGTGGWSLWKLMR